jgi:hypothetical protein
MAWCFAQALWAERLVAKYDSCILEIDMADMLALVGGCRGWMTFGERRGF